MNRSALMIALLCTTAFAACSDGPASQLLPTAPTQVTAPAATSGASGVINRGPANGSTVVRDPAAVREWTSGNRAFSSVSDLEVEGTGRIDQVTGTCPQRTATIHGIQVHVNDATSMSGGSCATLAAGQVVKVRGMLYVMGGQVQVVATAMTVEGPPARVVEGEGVVSTVQGGCPNASIVVHGVAVALTPATTVRWNDGAAAGCGDVAAGRFVHVRAEMAASGAVSALQVTLVR